MKQATEPVFETNDQRWNALVQRNRQADGTFFYAVKTTGVYCRPHCSSRLPNRHNVEFFLTCTDAEHAGYRACRRCHPQRLRRLGTGRLRDMANGSILTPGVAGRGDC